MSKIYRISLICVMTVAVIVLCILIIHYKEQTINSSEQNSADEMDWQYSVDLSDTQNNAFMDISAAELSETTTADTELIIIEIYPEGLSRQTQMDLPENLVGLNRSTMNQILETYCNAPEQIDIEKGLYRIEMTAFSENSVTIEKSYHKNVTEYYYLALVDDYVTVFYEDQKTVLLTTDIHSEQLPKSVREEILNYKLIIGNAELFDFLETYTS